MLDEAAHARPRNSTPTENLYCIPRRVLGSLRGVHLQQGNWTGKVLCLLFVRLHCLCEHNTLLSEQKPAHHVVHLVCNVFQPALSRFHTSNHGSKLAADHSLRCQGLSKCLALVNPFKALFYNPTLSTDRGCNHCPTFVVKITYEIHSVSSKSGKFGWLEALPQYNEESSPLRAKSVLHWHLCVVKRNICCSSRRGIARLDWRRLDAFAALNKDDCETILGFACDGEIVRKAAMFRFKKKGSNSGAAMTRTARS
jgi:hypothetical protein